MSRTRASSSVDTTDDDCLELKNRKRRVDRAVPQRSSPVSQGHPARPRLATPGKIEVRPRRGELDHGS